VHADDASWAAMLRARERRMQEEEAARAEEAAVAQEARRAPFPAQTEEESRRPFERAERDEGLEGDSSSRARATEIPTSAAARFMRNHTPVSRRVETVRRPWHEYARERPRASLSELGFG
jgi:hypothetical protein